VLRKIWALEGEEALAEVNELFSLAQAAAGIGSFVANLETKQVLVSGEYCDIFGLPHQDTYALDKIASHVVSSEHELYVDNLESNRYREDIILDSNFQIKRASDGELRWLHRTAKRIVKDGVVSRLYGIVQDVTDQLAYEAALRESEEHYRHTVVNSPLAMWSATPEGVLDFMSPRYEEWTGVPGPDNTWMQTLHPDDLPKMLEAIQIGLANKTGLDVFNRIRFRDGNYRWVHTKARARLDGQGNVVRWYGSTEDVHARREASIQLSEMNEHLEELVKERTKQLEETHSRLLGEITERQLAQAALTQAQKMESVGQLTGGIAHDFNNMLQIMIGNLELIKMQTSRVDESKTADKIGKFVSNAMDGANKAATLTSQLLAFSRKTRLHIDKVCANDVVPNVVDMITRSIGKNIAVKCSLEKNLWLCLSDRSQLEVALVNLALNARDAMPDGGELLIKTENRTFKEKRFMPGQRYVAVSVIDNGTGMSAETLDRVFEPFFTTKAVGKGTGLGLSMVYGFCQQANGKVEVFSTPGEGTRVEMLFPYARSKRNMQDDEHLLDEQPAKGPATVLVVDDEPGVRELAVNLLDSLGYNTIEASSADEALQRINSGLVVDLVFSDVVMPGTMDGFGLATTLKQIQPKLPVILTTGHAEVLLNGNVPEPLRNLKILGKPYRTADLSQCVASVLEKNTTTA
jgi:PAS domain S-box-containing protein